MRAGQPVSTHDQETAEDERFSSESAIDQNASPNTQPVAIERSEQSLEQLRRQFAGSCDLSVSQSRRDHQSHDLAMHSAGQKPGSEVLQRDMRLLLWFMKKLNENAS
jgi:hypothetical protein